MYNLSLHIEYLLQHHDCVVLPGIGAFINVRHSASYNSESGEWVPMHREVRFNGALKHDDGLLSTSYARKHGLDYAQGRELLREDLTRLKELLEKDGEATIGSIGILEQNGGSRIFRPMVTPLLIARAIGYESFVYFRNHSQVNAEEISTAYRAVPATDQTQSTKEEEKQNQPNKDSQLIIDTARNYYIKINKVMARTVAMIFIVTVVVLSIFLPGANRKEIDKASVIPVENIFIDQVSKQRKDSSPRETTAPEDLRTINERSDSTHLVGATDGNRIVYPMYYAVVGTFMTEKEAERYMQQHTSIDYPLEIVKTAARVRVTAMRTREKEDLLEMIQRGDFAEKFPEHWIWRREKE